MTLPRRVKIYGKFADAAYRSENKNFGDYKYIKSYPWGKLWLNDKAKIAILSVRGSTSAYDFVTDLTIAGGLNQIARSININTLTSLKKKGYKIIGVGHSLGATALMDILRWGFKSAHIFDEMYAYAPGATPKRKYFLFRQLDEEQNKLFDEKLHIYRIVGDPVSLFARNIKAKENITFPKQKLHIASHSSLQFIS